MGLIYQAHDPVIDRKVAIKLIRADLLGSEERADYLERFRHEAQAAGRCAHPNIVAIYDFAVHEGNPYLAMEYVEGSNLSQVLTQSGRFGVGAAVAVIAQVLDALACAHGLGVVHRDVKPANILLLPDRRVKMTDFGISRLDTSVLTLAGSVLGTPSYMSPEQCRGEPVDARSDLFSTGVVLFELLAGTRPFSGRNVAEISLQVISKSPPDLRVLRPELPTQMIAVVQRALAKRPEQRFASARDMAVALQASCKTPAKRRSRAYRWSCSRKACRSTRQRCIRSNASSPNMSARSPATLCRPRRGRPNPWRSCTTSFLAASIARNSAPVSATRSAAE